MIFTNPETINLKCDPEMAIDLREEHEENLSRFSHEQETWEHGKSSWKPQRIIDSGNDRKLYDLVVKSLPKKN